MLSIQTKEDIGNRIREIRISKKLTLSEHELHCLVNYANALLELKYNNEAS